MTLDKGADRQGLVFQLLQQQMNAVAQLAASVPESTDRLITALLAVQGRIIFIGIGKSGHVGRLLSATFSSVGLPAFFLHPSEALHGDMGSIRCGDICICLSKSGSGDEIERVLSYLSEKTITTFLLTCGSGSLTSLVDVVIRLPFAQEACPYNIVPTSSVLIMLAFGQAIALQVAVKRGFAPAYFAAVHPAGSLGASLRKKER